MHVADVFTHNSYPEYTYVEREQSELEVDLRNTLRMGGAVASISGPSKTGKSMLVKRVAKSEDSHITHMSEVHSSEISSVGDLWQEALNNLGEPTSTEAHTSEVDQTENTAKGGVDFGISAGGEHHHVEGETNTEIEVDDRRGLNKLVEVVNPKKYVLLIDDFHNLEEEVQEEIAKGIKGASERGLSICVALISYRSEDLEKIYPDLSNRVRKIELDLWEKRELKQIADLGFGKLNVDVEDSLIDLLARESGGSPLLMQLLCYSTCVKNNIIEPQDSSENIEYNQETNNKIFQEAIDWAGFNTVVKEIDKGAQTRGTDRREYELVDSDEITGSTSKGDYYRCCLRAIASGEPEFILHRDDLYERVKEECVHDRPQKYQVTQFCEKMEEIVEEERPNSSLVTWDEENNMLNISEPALLFNIRWSIRLGL